MYILKLNLESQLISSPGEFRDCRERLTEPEFVLLGQKGKGSPVMSGRAQFADGVAV